MWKDERYISAVERGKIYALLSLQIQQSKERDAAIQEQQKKIDNLPKT